MLKGKKQLENSVLFQKKTRVCFKPLSSLVPKKVANRQQFLNPMHIKKWNQFVSVKNKLKKTWIISLFLYSCIIFV